jgi:hypothetical protein
MSQSLKRLLKNPHRWLKWEDNTLKQLYEEHGNHCFTFVSAILEGRSSCQAKKRWKRYLGLKADQIVVYSSSESDNEEENWSDISQ